MILVLDIKPLFALNFLKQKKAKQDIHITPTYHIIWLLLFTFNTSSFSRFKFLTVFSNSRIFSKEFIELLSWPICWLCSKCSIWFCNSKKYNKNIIKIYHYNNTDKDRIKSIPQFFLVNVLISSCKCLRLIVPRVSFPLTIDSTDFSVIWKAWWVNIM